MKNEILMHREHHLWLQLCEMLERSGAVTEADLKTLASAPPTTPGTELIHTIRDWSTARAELERSSR